MAAFQLWKNDIHSTSIVAILLSPSTSKDAEAVSSHFHQRFHDPTLPFWVGRCDQRLHRNFQILPVDYNAANAITSILHHQKRDETTLVQHRYTHGETNNLIEYLNSPDSQTSYAYDFLRQLISVNYANQNLSNESYSYDENSNPILANGSSYTTGTNNELTSNGTCTYTYDDEGNRIFSRSTPPTVSYTNGTTKPLDLRRTARIRHWHLPGFNCRICLRL